MSFTNLPEGVESKFIQAEGLGLKLHYLEMASSDDAAEVVLLVHGWPTSSYLYRNMMPILAEGKRVIAMDLPGYGLSDKPPNASYSFPYHGKAIDALLEALNISNVHLVVHDLGGPIALWWSANNPERVSSYVVLDTTIDANFSWAVKVFVGMTLLPISKQWITSPSGIKFSMRFGLHEPKCMSKESLLNYQLPFTQKQDRIALRRSASTLHMKGFKLVEQHMSSLDKPLCIIYADDDRILPEVPERFGKLASLYPDAPLHVIEGAGHFLQEEKPEEVATAIKEFYQSM